MNLQKLLIFLTFLGLMNCKKDVPSPVVNSELLIPLISSTLTINQIIPDSIREEDADGNVSLVYRSLLCNTSLGSFRQLKTNEYSKTANLQTLKLSAKSAFQQISLGQAAQNMGAVGTYIIQNNDSIKPFPSASGLSYGPLPLNASSFFQTVEVDSGFMDITINNGFPTGMSNVRFEIRNQISNTLVGLDTFIHIDAGATETVTLNLMGKTVEGHMLAKILKYAVDGTGTTPVLIDTTNKLTITLTVRNLKVSSATAVFPAQPVIDFKDTSQLTGVDDILLTKAKAKSGFVSLQVTSTVADTLYFEYSIPGSIRNGTPLVIHEKINPAVNGNPITANLSYDVSGYTFDLTGAPIYNTQNALYSELSGRIDSNGKVVNISLQDYISVKAQLSGFIPEYIEGYLGHTALEIGPTSIPLDLFKHVLSGNLEFDKVKVSLGVSNGSGVPFKVDIKALSAQNTKLNKSVNIDLSAIPSPMMIEGAGNLFLPWEETWKISESTGNINQALNIMPNRLNYQLSVESNPNQSVDLTQFAIDTNQLSAFTDIEVPLSLVADHLLMADTVTFDPSKINQPENIASGVLYIIADNTFPLEVSSELVFLGLNDEKLLEVSFDESISPGSKSMSNRTVISWEFDRGEFDKIFDASKVVMKANLSTSSTQTPVKIYSVEQLKLKLSAKFNYMLEF